jgi:hypothetical protein
LDGSKSSRIGRITGTLGPGSVDFGIDCDQLSGDIQYGNVSITAVAISPD